MPHGGAEIMRKGKGMFGRKHRSSHVDMVPLLPAIPAEMSSRLGTEERLGLVACVSDLRSSIWETPIAAVSFTSLFCKRHIIVPLTRENQRGEKRYMDMKVPEKG